MIWYGGGAIYVKSRVTIKFWQLKVEIKLDCYLIFHIDGAPFPHPPPPYHIIWILKFKDYIYLAFKKSYSYHVFWRLTSFLNVKPKIINFWLFGKIFKSMARALIAVYGHIPYFHISHITLWGGLWGGATIMIQITFISKNRDFWAKNASHAFGKVLKFEGSANTIW